MAKGPGDTSRSGRECGVDGSGLRLALRRLLVASWREVRAQHELAVETARLETAVCLGDLIEGDALGDAWPDGASCQQTEEPLQILPEPRGMPRPHRIDRIDADALAAGEPAQQPPPQVHARDPYQHGRQTMLRLHPRRVAVSAEQAAALQRRKRPAIAVLADAVEDNVEPARQDAREVLALIVDRRGAKLADQLCVCAARRAPQFQTGQP